MVVSNGPKLRIFLTYPRPPEIVTNIQKSDKNGSFEKIIEDELCLNDRSNVSTADSEDPPKKAQKSPISKSVRPRKMVQ